MPIVLPLQPKRTCTLVYPRIGKGKYNGQQYQDKQRINGLQIEHFTDQSFLQRNIPRRLEQLSDLLNMRVNFKKIVHSTHDTNICA